MRNRLRPAGLAARAAQANGSSGKHRANVEQYARANVDLPTTYNHLRKRERCFGFEGRRRTAPAAPSASNWTHPQWRAWQDHLRKTTGKGSPHDTRLRLDLPEPLAARPSGGAMRYRHRYRIERRLLPAAWPWSGVAGRPHPRAAVRLRAAARRGGWRVVDHCIGVYGARVSRVLPHRPRPGAARPAGYSLVRLLLAAMTAYYNEIDPYAAQWLQQPHRRRTHRPGRCRRAINCRCSSRRPPGLRPVPLLRRHRRMVPTPFASPDGTTTDLFGPARCPCQPFSAAGKGGGGEDERHLWPHWFRLIRECRPAVVFGETC